ncbi:MAG TPA: DUF2203 domain-containing protein [Chloroflexota bacterium]|nr:DUF2203 domain-containing protein [Chloroflexota bacterium]
MQREESTAIDEYSGAQPRIFTMEEALEVLPTIKTLFLRFNRAREVAAEIADDLKALEERRTRANTLELARPLRQHREALGEQVEQMRLVVHSVQDLGVEIKRLDPALVDFRSYRYGRVVYLCWQEGEDTICYWHDLDSGFAGRRPL